MTITVEHTISMGHRLPSYNGICASPHGHNVRFEIEIHTHEFLDFKEVSGRLKDYLAPRDHAMVLWKNDPFITLLMHLPEARVVVCDTEPTTEALAIDCFNYFKNSYYPSIVRVTVYETDKYSATVRA